MAIIRLEMASVAIYGHYYDANTMMGSKLYALIFHPYNKREGTLYSTTSILFISWCPTNVYL